MDDPQRVHLFLSPPGWRVQLIEELRRVFPGDDFDEIGECWVATDAASPTNSPSLAFSLQSMPDVTILPSISIRKDADALAIQMRSTLEMDDSLCDLHVFVPLDVGFAKPGKAKLLRTALLDSLKRKAKSLLPRLRPDPDGGHSLVQITWLAPDRLAFSHCDAAERNLRRRCLSRWPGGVSPVANDPRPPSRAYRKLLEAEAQMSRRIEKNQWVVDLGASPGGWTFVALDHGARVVAVDRSPLRPDLMQHPRLTFVPGDAFKFVPETPVDWMIADVAAYPTRTLALVERWLSNGWCRNLVTTVKFVGADGYAILEEFKARLDSNADDFRLRKLLENKNEVTVMAWRDTKDLPSSDAATATAT